ncbi:YjdF family protein [Numidum massiliense]|uniref:YjdF family protein n=1 Tax=Numidum massiliense TaxID=1522315 RepID=UPI0006D5A866|nr:YjdF family protein [Numidum massiliense]
MKLSVFFDGHFWVGVIEDAQTATTTSKHCASLRAWKHIFGSEPRNTEVLQFVQQELAALISQPSVAVSIEVHERQRINPKRLARQVAKEMTREPVSTYAQTAMQLEMEKRARKRKKDHREHKEAKAARTRDIRRQKAKAKHRGR